MKRRRKQTPGGAPAPARGSKSGRPAAKPAQDTGRVITREDWLRLQHAFREAQETLDAIRAGEVDAVVVAGKHGDQVYSLAGAEQPYRVYVEQMQEGAVTVTADGMILYCNQRFATMARIPLGRAISAALQPFITAQTWAEISAIFTGEPEVVKCEAVLRDAQGGSLPVLLTSSRLPIGADQVMCLVVTDLTSHHEQAELRLGKELAEKASLAKDSFLAALSHELRTPLNPALIAAVALEQDESLPPGARQDLAMIRRNIELEARLIDDLLDLTRIEQGKFDLQLGVVELHAVVLQALEVCRPEIEAKRQQIALHLDAQTTVTAGDAVRVQQVIWNLLRNAAKFTPEGGSIVVRTTNAASDRLSVEVEDSGIGFAPETAPSMFLPFQQGGRHITRQFGGLGLGLAISRSIAEAHGGTIRARSAGPGRGATFTLELPIRATAPAPVAAPSAPAPSAASAGLRLLLVEDHRDTRISMQFLLQRAGYRVAGAETAAEAKALAARQAFDVVVTDLGLPDQSGIELMRELRDRHGLPGIATSGYGMEHDLARSREAGFVHHFTKPINLQQLRRALDELHARPDSAR